MLLTILVFVGGALTILSPCILPVLLRAFSRPNQSFVRRRLPFLAGMALTFAAAAILAASVDTTVLAGISRSFAGGPEAKLVERFPGGTASAKNADGARDGAWQREGATSAFRAPRSSFIRRVSASTNDAPLPVEGRLPSLSGAVEWINSPPLTADQLRGKVVVVEVWTYSCINCLRTLPYVKAWSKKYHDKGLVVIGVHAPEFAFERDIGNVRRATRDLGVDYPVAVDNHFAIWRALGNQYWPALYIVDAQGRIRHHQFGEGGYDRSAQAIQQLLSETGQTKPATAPEKIEGSGTQMGSDMKDVRSGETYIGYSQAEGFISPEGVLEDRSRTYSTPPHVSLNNWSLSGDWTIGAEYAALRSAHGKIVYRFHARDLHLVLGTQPGAKPVRFRVTIDGAPPGAAHGSDVAADGRGTIDGQRLYQLVRQPGDIQDRTFVIEFLDPGANAYAFTFG